MKVALICFNLSFVAGGQRLVFSLARALQKRGHTVIIYAPDFDGEHYAEISAGLDIRTVKLSHPISWFSRSKNIFKWATSKARQEYEFISASKKVAAAMDTDFDIINIHDSAYRTAYFYAKHNHRAKIIWTQNAPPFIYLPKGKFLFNLLSKLYHFLKNWSSKKYFRVMDKVAVLDFYNKAWSEEHGLKNAVIIRAGINFENFYAPVKDFREKAKTKSVRLLALGALNPYRRYDNVIMAVADLRKQGYDAKALIIANHIWHEDECKAALISLVKKNHLEEAIDLRFEGVSEEELRRAYRESDVFVQAVYVPPPSNHGWGLVNFEAMAAGLPVVLCRTATATEVLKDGENAFFVDPLSPEQIAEKVKAMVDNPELYMRVTTAGQEFTRKYMSWEKYTEETLKLFKD